MIVDDKLMTYVLYKMRTIEETKRKCKLLKYEEDYIDEVIDYLKEAGYLDDERYVKKYIKNVMKLKHASRNEIKIDLMRRGIADYVIEPELDNEDVYEFECESCKYLVDKKQSQGIELIKIKKYLVGKGYSYDIINLYID